MQLPCKNTSHGAAAGVGARLRGGHVEGGHGVDGHGGDEGKAGVHHLQPAVAKTAHARRRRPRRRRRRNRRRRGSA